MSGIHSYGLLNQVAACVAQANLGMLYRAFRVFGIDRSGQADRASTGVHLGEGLAGKRENGSEQKSREEEPGHTRLHPAGFATV
jgi:hypothetical protein